MKTIKVTDTSAFVGKLTDKLEALDGGYFATVYLSKDGTRVYKVLNRPDPAYLAYLEEAEKHKGNPFLPVVYSVIAVDDLLTQTVIISLELLQEAGGMYSKNAMRTVQISMAAYSIAYNKAVLPDSPDALESAIGCITSALRVKSAFLDMHHGNFMLRGKQIVITDPVGSAIW